MREILQLAFAIGKFTQPLIRSISLNVVDMGA
jgi:hypothetical protein